MKRFRIPALPFVLSMALSLATAGSHVHWQDSGFFLVAVHDLGILYPPGFALYVLLAKAWTLALSFIDFTYAVHLFSAFCAALAAGTIAVAARDLLRTKGPLFRTVAEEGPMADVCGIAAGCLAATGYTFWAAAILAKVYAFYFLILSLLIWRMIRADESGKPRDFTIVAALIGLAWQAHPSATNAGVALILFVAFHHRLLGGKGIAWRTGLAALCAIGPIHLLTLFHYCGRNTLVFGEVGSFSGFTEYVSGTRFTYRSDAFGIEGSRVLSVGRFGWEEFLGVGAVASLAGLVRLWTLNRRLLVGLAAWNVPVLFITVLFRIEGQHDFWMVAAWLPLWLAAAVGLHALRKPAAVALASLLGVIWAGAVNYPDLDARNNVLPEMLGRAYLDAAEGGDELALESDDAQAITLYLQTVRGVRKDLPLLLLGVRRYSKRGLLDGYHEAPPDLSEWEAEDHRVIPWGPLFRVVPANRGQVRLKTWKEPIEAEKLPAMFRRARGQVKQDGVFKPEPYEKRLLRVLLLARRNEAETLAREGKLPEAARLCESILRIDPDMGRDASLTYQIAVIDTGLKRFPEAEAGFKKVLTLHPAPLQEATAYYFLTALSGARPEAAEWKAKALASKDLPALMRAKLEGK